ncbi:MAG: hypothetical protein ACM3MD_11505 [Betaproteobacteria bacterium]
MKKILLLAFLCVYPVVTEGHPGKTDHYGGHMCLKGCEEWKLFYKEYHLHDKDWKPIRVRKQKKESEPKGRTAETNVPEMSQVEKPMTGNTITYRYVTNVYEENVFSPNPLLYVLLVLLLLLLILRINKKSEE